MKDRDIRMRKTIKAMQVKEGDVIEVAGQRVRVDRRREGKGGKVVVTQFRLGTSNRAPRRLKLHPRKHVDLVRR